MLEHKGETVRLIWLPEPIRMKLQQHPMTRGAQVADIRLSENRYVPDVPISGGVIAIMAAESFDLFGAHEIIDVENITGA